MRGAEAFLHLPPSILQADRLFEETGILRSKPHSPPRASIQQSVPKETIPTWPAVAALLLALLAPSQGIRKSVQLLIAV